MRLDHLLSMENRALKRRAETGPQEAETEKGSGDRKTQRNEGEILKETFVVQFLRIVRGNGPKTETGV